LPKNLDLLAAALVGGGAADRTHIFDILHVRRAHHPSLLHSAAEIWGTHERARVFDAVPVQQQGHVSRIVHALEQTAPGLSGVHAGIEVGIEGFFPAVEICHLVADQYMNHEKASQNHFDSSKIRNLWRNVNREMLPDCVMGAIDSAASELMQAGGEAVCAHALYCQ
jgi:hypothetical protein